MREAFAASSDRLAVLSRLRSLRTPAAPKSPTLIVTTPEALLQPVPALQAFATSELVLARGSTQPFAQLLERLQALDYDSEAVCEAPGHYAVRGGIIDVYPITASQPYRLDWSRSLVDDFSAIKKEDLEVLARQFLGTEKALTIGLMPSEKGAAGNGGKAAAVK